MKKYAEIVNYEKTTYIRDGITYRVDDVISGSKLDELSGHNTGDKTSRYILTLEPLCNFDDNIYNRERLYEIHDDKYKVDSKLEDMKKYFDFLPPIPEKGDGLHRIVAAKELSHKTILMWKKYE